MEDQEGIWRVKIHLRDIGCEYDIKGSGLEFVFNGGVLVLACESLDSTTTVCVI